MKSAGPPSRMTPASGSPSSSPPRQVRRAERLPRLEAGLHERFDLPGELVGPGRAATEIGAGRDRDAGRMGADGRSPRPARSGSAIRWRALGSGEPLDRRRRRRTSARTGTPPASRRGSCRARPSPRRAPRRARSRARWQSTPPCTPARAPARSPEWAVTLRAPRVGGRHDPRDLVGRPRRDAGVGPVEIELEQVRRRRRAGPSPAASSSSASSASTRALAGHRAGAVQPRPGGADVRVARPALPAVTHAEAERPRVGHRPDRSPGARRRRGPSARRRRS